jgi:hypothetical protein
MADNIKSGKDVLDEFFSEILNVPGTHEKTLEKLISLYSMGKLTDTNLQNALDEIISEEISEVEKENDEN